MMPPLSSKSYTEFEQESQRIHEVVWAAMAIAPKSHALFLGFDNSRAVIERALQDKVDVTVVESNPRAIREADALGVTVIRASSSGIPVRSEAFDVAIAHYYLHEADPSFHPQVTYEMSRVARRIAIVEPGPPADLLGSRIAGLYARAKRNHGQFEQYQNVEYWRRLLQGVRPVVVPLTISYSALPPRAFLRDTMSMMLDLMRIGGISESDLQEMKALAQASDVQMLPQPRYVLLAAASHAEIPDRPRLVDLESQAANRMRAPRGKKLPDAPTPHPVSEALAAPTPTRTPPIARPVTQAPIVPPAMVEAIAPAAAVPRLTPTIAFDVPPIHSSDAPIEDLFKRPQKASKAPKQAAQWDKNEPAEMPDFGLPDTLLKR